MYARYYRNADREIFLYNTNTLELRTVARSSGRAWTLRSDQVSGPYAVFEKYEVRRHELKSCDVYLYDITNKTKTKLANPNAKCQYSPAVNPAGTVFFARSGWGCGRNTVLREQPLAGSATTFVTLARGHDIGSLYAVDNGGGSTDVYYDPYKCGSQSDLVKVTEP
jgi:Tol biopolymer transport system component